MAVEAAHRAHVTVNGMTCQHCVMSVTEEIEEIPGVTGVEVVLADGTVTVLADRALDQADIAAAVAAAGYSLAD